MRPHPFNREELWNPEARNKGFQKSLGRVITDCITKLNIKKNFVSLKNAVRHALLQLRHGWVAIRVRAKTIEGESWQPKTKINRAVQLNTTLRRHFDAYPPRIVPGGWFFPSPDGKRWDPDNFSQDLRALNEGTHLPWACLDYRRSFNSQLAIKANRFTRSAR